MQKRLLFVLLLSSTMMMVSCRKDIEAVNIGANSGASSSDLRGRVMLPPTCQWESIKIRASRDPRDQELIDQIGCYGPDGQPRPCASPVLRSATLKVFSTLSSETVDVPGFPLTLNELQPEIEATGFPPFQSLGGRIEYFGDAKVTITIKVQGKPPFVIEIAPNFSFLKGQIFEAVLSSKVKNYGISSDCSLQQ